MQSITGISPIDGGLFMENEKKRTSGTNEQSFDSLFQSALDLLNETNTLTNKAEEEEIKFAMGESTSVHDLQLAQHKANVSLQYTVAVRNAVLDAYRDIINMQI